MEATESEVPIMEQLETRVLLDGTWEPPLGIPAPDFGIQESHWLYAGQRFDFDGDGVLEPGEEYRDAGNGPYTHYVDNTSPAATDTSNPFGTAAKPRLTLPSGSSLAPGSVVEIHGNPYLGGEYRVRSSGTAAAPIFFRGVLGQRPIIERIIRVMGAYIIFENLDCNKNQRAEGAFDIRPDAASSGQIHHIAIRGCEIHNYMLDPLGNNAMIGVSNAYLNNGDLVHDVVIYNNYIHDNGRAVTAELDIHGVNVLANVERLWYVDNISHDNAGDSIQVSYYAQAPLQEPRYIYIGRNEFHDDDENAVDLKGCSDVVVSQNRMYNYLGGSPGSDCTAVVIHYDTTGHAERVWLLANEIYNTPDKATSVTGGSDEIYFIGNVIHDIHNATGTGTAFSSWQSEKLYLFNNTVYNVDIGVGYEGTSATSLATIQNNIFGNLYTAGAGYHLRLDYSDYQHRAVIDHNLFYQAGGNARIYWNGPIYNVAGWQAATGKGAGCLEADPLFVDPANRDFHPQATSPAIDTGLASQVYDTFQALYGLDIRVDFSGTPRPLDGDGLNGAQYDIGAYEFVSGGNHTPAVQNDAYSVNQDQTLTVPAPGVLANDSDPDGDPLTTILVSGVAHGTLTLGAAGAFTYTPNAGFYGTDTFSYEASDGQTRSNAATVTITVVCTNHPPVVVSDAATTNEDTQVVTPNVLANDTDPDGDPLSIAAFTQAQHGTVASNGDGTFTYRPNTNYNGSDYFNYTASDGRGGQAIGTVYITVTPVNDRPTATAQSATVAEDGSVLIALAGTDVETAAANLVAAIGTQPAHGTLALVSGKQYRYTPAANYNGSDSFTFTVTDDGSPAGSHANPGDLTSDPATVSITVAPVNDKPTATAQSVSVNEDGSVTITLAGTDVETAAASLVAAIATQPAHGTLALVSGKQYRYTPAANYNGSDSFTFTVRDNGDPAGVGTSPALTSDPATVSITVAPVNDKPTATGQSVSVNENGTLTITLAGTDVETPAASLVAAIGTQPAHGTLTLASGNQYRYTPAANYNGPDSFTFTVTDNGDPAGGHANPGDLTSNPATVSITVTPVNDRPTANGQSVTTSEHVAKVITLAGSDLETPAGQLIFSIVASPQHGTLSGVTGNQVTYTPTGDYNGPDAFAFSVTDTGDPAGVGTSPALSSNPATVYVVVNPVNDRPVATAQSVTVNEDGSVDIALAGTDVETPAMSLVAAIATQPAHGTLTLASGNQYRYTPAANYNGPDSFTFTVTDNGDPAGSHANPGDLTSNPATVRITVTPVNDQPTANGQPVTTSEHVAKVITLTGSDLETPAGQLIFSIVASPQHGTLSGVTGNQVTYTPTGDYNGPDAFAFSVTDTGDPAGVGTSPALSSNSATVYVVVNPANDKPAATAQSVWVSKDGSVNIALAGTDVETTSANLVATIGTQPAHGTLTLVIGNQYLYTPAAGYDGSDSFTFTVTDNGDPAGVGASPALSSNPATVYVVVNPVNVKPVATAQSVSVSEDGSVNITLAGTDVETASANLVAALKTQPVHGTLTLVSGNQYLYTPAANYNGPDSFAFTVTDDGSPAGSHTNPADLTSDPATVSITVIPVNDAPVATAQSVTVNEDGSVDIALAGTDVETFPTSLVAAIGTQPAHGTLALISRNLCRYMPAANYNGSDSFTFTVTDNGDPAEGHTNPGDLTSNPAAVSITVTPVNDRPTATAQSVTIDEDGWVNITLAGTDVETAAANLVAAIATQPAHGTLTLVSGNQYRYTPAANYNGQDSFTFTVRDNGDPAGVGTSPALASSPATVSITVAPVNDKPVAQPQSQYSGIATPLTLTLGATDVETPYANMTFNIPARSAHGTLTQASHGVYTYLPDATYSGADSFTFTVTDTGDPAATSASALTSDPATVGLSVYRKQHFTSKTKAHYVDARGNKVTVSLSGPGSGDLYFVADAGLASAPGSGDGYLVAAEPPPDARALVLNETTAASRVMITTAPSARTTIQDIIINGALASLTGRTTDLTGDIAATGAAPRIALGDVKGPSEIRVNTRLIALARPPQLSMTFRDVADCSIDTGGLAIGSLRVARWLNTDGKADTIQAPGLNTLMVTGRTIYSKTGSTRIAGDFEASLRLTGLLPAGRSALSLARISGNLADAAWDIGGAVGALHVGSVGDDFAGTFAGRISSLSAGGNLSGHWTARSIGGILVCGSLVGADVTLTQGAAPESRATALGYMCVRKWIDTSSLKSAGTIGSITAGAIRDSDVFVGVSQTQDVRKNGRADLPDPDADFDALAAIKGLIIYGLPGEPYAMIDSNIAAADLGRVSIRSVKGDNGGETFGFAGKHLGSLRCASAVTTPASWPNLPSLGDFAVRVA